MASAEKRKQISVRVKEIMVQLLPPSQIVKRKGR